MNYVIVVQLHKEDSLKDVVQLLSNTYVIREDCHVFIMSNNADQLIELRENIEEIQESTPYYTIEMFLNPSLRNAIPRIRLEVLSIR